MNILTTFNHAKCLFQFYIHLGRKEFMKENLPTYLGCYTDTQYPDLNDVSGNWDNALSILNVITCGFSCLYRHRSTFFGIQVQLNLTLPLIGYLQITYELLHK